jgi:hypothetical protein
MSDVGASRYKTAMRRYVQNWIHSGKGWSDAAELKPVALIGLRLRRLAADFFAPAPRHVGIGDAESVIIHRLFALFARHVPASIDAALDTPGI